MGFSEKIASLYLQKTAQDISRLFQLVKKGDQKAAEPLLRALQRRGDSELAGEIILPRIPFFTPVVSNLGGNYPLYLFVQKSLHMVALKYLNFSSSKISFTLSRFGHLLAIDRETGDPLPFFVRFLFSPWVKKKYPLLQFGEGTSGLGDSVENFPIRDVKDLQKAAEKISLGFSG